VIILGTAGHIDHGKTTLIRALTGIDTDRLLEEKTRGISIELGFAHLDLPSGERLGVIDVPGHERFVRQMISGAVGVDLVLLVVAADEGIMPQTREHMDICRLLGVDRGAVVLTKTDLVDEDWLGLVREDVRAFVQGTFLEQADVLTFSAKAPGSFPEFRAAIGALVKRLFPEPPARAPDQVFMLPVDRAFSMRGFGTVVTGTVTSGALREGETVEVLPSGLVSKVRGVEVHGASVEEARAGRRTALNLQHLEKTEVQRGEVVVRSGTARPTRRVDVRLTLVERLGKPVKTGARVLFHSGTNHVEGSVVLLDRDELAPGATALVQMRLDGDAIVLPGHGFILRGFEVQANYGKTLGGGKILDPQPDRHKRGDGPTIARLGQLASGTDEERIGALLEAMAERGIGRSALHARTNLPASRLDKLLGRMMSDHRARRLDSDGGERFFDERAAEALAGKLVGLVSAYHEASPAKPGLPKEELRSKLGVADARLFASLLGRATSRGLLEETEDLVRVKGFVPRVTDADRIVAARLAEIFRLAALEPPSPAECVGRTGAPQVLVDEAIGRLVREGTIVKVRDGLYFEASALDGLKARLVTFLKERGEITTTELKELVGASRKYVIPIGEYFDRAKVTIRISDVKRRLRSGAG